MICCPIMKRNSCLKTLTTKSALTDYLTMNRRMAGELRWDAIKKLKGIRGSNIACEFDWKNDSDKT